MLRLRKSERTAHLVIQLLQSIVLLPNIAVLFGSGVLCKLCKQDKERSPLVLYRDSCMAECSDFNTMQTKKEKMGRNCYKRQLSRIESLASIIEVQWRSQVCALIVQSAVVPISV